MSRTVIWDENYTWAAASQNVHATNAIEQYLDNLNILMDAMDATQNVTARMQTFTNNSLEARCFITLANYMPSHLEHITEWWLDRLPRQNCITTTRYHLVFTGNSSENIPTQYINTAFDPADAGIIRCMAALKGRLLYIYEAYGLGEGRFAVGNFAEYVRAMAALEALQL